MGAVYLDSSPLVKLAVREPEDISELIVYDWRLAEAARQLGYRVTSPS